MIDIGDPVPLRLTTRNAAKVPTDVVSVTLEVTLPDGTVVTPTVDHVALSGVYTATHTATVEGLHSYRWEAVDPVNFGSFVDEFTVDDGYVPFVGLSEQLTFMRATGVITDPTDLETLRGFIRVACEAVELDTNSAISQQTITRTYDGGSAALVLPGPVLSVTTVVESGTTLTGTDYVLDTNAGILYRGTTTAVRTFTSGIQNVAVTLRAGSVRPSSVLRKVAKNGAQRMWQQSQQMPHPTLDDVDAEMQVAAGVLTPLEYAAYQKLRKATGFA